VFIGQLTEDNSQNKMYFNTITNDIYGHDFGRLILLFEDVIDSHLQLLYIVDNTGECQTGILVIYTKDEFLPITEHMNEQAFSLNNKLLALRDKIAEVSDHKFKQHLIQMKFEFDHRSHRSITAKYFKKLFGKNCPHKIRMAY
jgi:hypothetical protein